MEYSTLSEKKWVWIYKGQIWILDTSHKNMFIVIYELINLALLKRRSRMNGFWGLKLGAVTQIVRLYTKHVNILFRRPVTCQTENITPLTSLLPVKSEIAFYYVFKIRLKSDLSRFAVGTNNRMIDCLQVDFHPETLPSKHIF